MRKILDQVDPMPLRKSFRSYFELLRQAKVVKDYEYFAGMTLVSIDGVEHFSSLRSIVSSAFKSAIAMAIYGITMRC
jgi:hypothetical protein